MNHESKIEDLRLLGPKFRWSAVLYLLNNPNVQNEVDIIAMIRYLLSQGFHIADVFGNVPDKNGQGDLSEGYTDSEKSTIKNTALILAIERKMFQVVNFLVSESFVNWWNTKDLKA